MATKPVLFNGKMVRAILNKRKTQTRRVVKPQPVWSTSAIDMGKRNGMWCAVEYEMRNGLWNEIQVAPAPYQPGDILEIVETRKIPGCPEHYKAGSDGEIYSWAQGKRRRDRGRAQWTLERICSCH